MDIKVNAKRQATIPARALEALGVNPGDCLEVTRGPDVIVLRVKRENSGDTGGVAGKIDYSMYGTLRDNIDPNAPPFDIHEFRKKLYGH